MFASRISRFATSSFSAASRQIVKSQHAIEKAEGMGGVVRRSFGIAEMRHHDPFLVLDEFWHPHRGFETVTYILGGGQIQHEDFAGNQGTIGPGDLQWMTAGRGIVHCEMPLKTEASLASAAIQDYDVTKDPNATHGLQLWVNLSSKDKQCAPAYQDLRDHQIPRVQPSDGVTIKVIAGESHGVKSKVYTRTPTMYLDFNVDKAQTVQQTIPKDYSGFVYMISGKAYFGDGPIPASRAKESSSSSSEAKDEKDNHIRVNPNPSLPFLGRAHHSMVLSQDDDTDCLQIRTTADEGAHFILFAGQPLKEPAIQDRLFVMNSKEEVKQTIEDYKQAKNGFENAKDWRSHIAPKGYRLKLYP
ncbi:hypothetical protein BGZ83_009863 [Gryganskiella cystojenkinii]|nr:hypothetical protein BGZ83_009863 [Gryganskiella cystojenkinii]